MARPYTLELRGTIRATSAPHVAGRDSGGEVRFESFITAQRVYGKKGFAALRSEGLRHDIPWEKWVHAH